MDWDDFIKKMNKAGEHSPDIIKSLMDEFETWDKLAFAILEMTLYERIKWSDLNFALTNDIESGNAMVKAISLNKRLEEFKKDF